MNFNNFQALDMEQAHQTLAELVSNTKVLIEATKISQQTSTKTIQTFQTLSEKFLNRNTLVGYEMTELMSSLRTISDSIQNNQESASIFNTNQLAKSLQSLIDNSNISDRTRTNLMESFQSHLEKASGQQFNNDTQEALLESSKAIVDMLAQQEQSNRIERLQSSKSIELAKNTDSILSSYVDTEQKITLEKLAKDKSRDVSQGAIAGKVDYIENLFGINGTTDYISDKMGDIFGIKNLKEKLLTKIGIGAKNIYKGIEEFLPEAMQLDEKRFYLLNQEIVANSSKILQDIDNEAARQRIKHDKKLSKLRNELAQGNITLSQYDKQQEELSNKLNKSLSNIESKRQSAQKAMDDALLSISDVDLTNATENLYMTIENNKRSMEADLNERLKKGIISEREATASRTEFNGLQSALKSSLPQSFKANSNFDLETYIKETTQAYKDGALNTTSPEVEAQIKQLNDNFEQFLAQEAESKRKEELSSNIFNPSKESEDATQEDSLLPDIEKQQQEGENLITDTISDFFGFEGNSSKNSKVKGKRPGKLSRMFSKITDFGSKTISFASKAAVPLAAAKAAYDGYQGWDRADENFNLAPNQEATTGQKTSSAAGSIISGLSFGLIDEKSAANTIYDVSNKVIDKTKEIVDDVTSSIANFFGFGNKKDASKAIKESIAPSSSTIQGITKNSDQISLEQTMKQTNLSKEMVDILKEMKDNLTQGGTQVIQQVKQVPVHIQKRVDDLGITLMNQGL